MILSIRSPVQAIMRIVSGVHPLASHRTVRVAVVVRDKSPEIYIGIILTFSLAIIAEKGRVDNDAIERAF